MQRPKNKHFEMDRMFYCYCELFLFASSGGQKEIFFFHGGLTFKSFLLIVVVWTDEGV